MTTRGSLTVYLFPVFSCVLFAFSAQFIIILFAYTTAYIFSRRPPYHAVKSHAERSIFFNFILSFYKQDGHKGQSFCILVSNFFVCLFVFSAQFILVLFVSWALKWSNFFSLFLDTRIDAVSLSGSQAWREGWGGGVGGGADSPSTFLSRWWNGALAK